VEIYLFRCIPLRFLSLLTSNFISELIRAETLKVFYYAALLRWMAGSGTFNWLDSAIVTYCSILQAPQINELHIFKLKNLFISFYKLNINSAVWSGINPRYARYVTLSSLHCIFLIMRVIHIKDKDTHR